MVRETERAAFERVNTGRYIEALSNSGALDALAGPARGQRGETSRTNPAAPNTYHGDYHGFPRRRRMRSCTDRRSREADRTAKAREAIVRIGR
jgi:hypothetical protein